ncbi:hypothetical protein E2562_001778 [Oryza meyeriana var. granulata]|uniref:DUF834 domain-containing protein n=1 Tax=Oryza meyeriana var. granulata TaxID=110450 RepID=A0A6G1CDA7_9ORYZ|nr:hypothetical protein E2562_001778 [Oryza meyeriana var. granulata]
MEEGDLGHRKGVEAEEAWVGNGCLGRLVPMWPGLWADSVGPGEKARRRNKGRPRPSLVEPREMRRGGCV